MHAGKQETASEIEQLLLVGARQEQEAAYFSLFLLGLCVRALGTR